VEADQAIANALSALFTLEGFSPVVFRSAEELLANFKLFTPDAIIANLSLPGLGGLQILHHLRAKDALVPTFMLGGDASSSEMSKAMTLGAYEVIKQPYDAQRLVNAVGRTIRFDLRRHILERKSNAPALASLTPREIQVVELLAFGHSSKEAAQKMDISFRTVEVHRGSAIAKVGAKNTVDLIRVILTG
jgi:FixJ family two-component response regulator